MCATIVKPTAGTPSSANVSTRVRMPRRPRVTGRSAALPRIASTRPSVSAGPLARGSIWTSWNRSPRRPLSRRRRRARSGCCPSPAVIPSRRPSRSRTARIGASSSMTMANEEPLIGRRDGPDGDAPRRVQHDRESVGEAEGVGLRPHELDGRGRAPALQQLDVQAGLLEVAALESERERRLDPPPVPVHAERHAIARPPRGRRPGHGRRGSSQQQACRTGSGTDLASVPSPAASCRSTSVLTASRFPDGSARDLVDLP